MTTARRPGRGRGSRRWMVAALVVVAAAGSGSWALLGPRPTVGRSTILAGLRVVQVGHLVVLAVAVAGAVVLGGRVALGRRRGVRRPGSARALLACGSTLVALAGLEGAAVLWRGVAHRVAVAATVAAPPAGRLAADDLYLVVLGESSALGAPYAPCTSVGQIAEWQLRRVFPWRRVRVDVLAENALTLEGALRKFADLPRRPDAVVLYSGHNEVASRYPLDRAVPHYLDEASPFDRLAWRAREASPLARLIQEVVDAQKTTDPPPPELRHLVDVPALTAVESARLLADFRGRLEAFAVACERLGALPIFVIPPGNDAGFEPNRSVLAPATPKADRDALARRFEAARGSEKGDPARAVAGYRAIVAEHPSFAEAHFRLARLLARSGAVAEANRHYEAARDGDALPIRCPTPYHDAYRAVAARHRCLLIDGPAVFRRASARGIVDDGLFHDAQHPNLIGYVALARDLLDQLRARKAFGWPGEAPPPAFDAASCAARFGLGPEQWAIVCVHSMMFYHGALPLRYDPAERWAANLRYGQAARAIGMRVPPEKLGIVGVGTPEAAGRENPM